MPKSTLHDAIRRKAAERSLGTEPTRRGRPQVLTVAEERAIVRACISLSSLGFGLSRGHVSKIVADYIKSEDRPNPFKDGRPGKKWWSGFLRRWKAQLSERKPEHLSKKRSDASKNEIREGFYNELESVLSKQGLLDLPQHELAPRLWNCDESGFRVCGCHSKARVLAKKGTKTISDVSEGSDKEQISVLFCGSAIGQVVPPYIVYKSAELTDSWLTGGPKGTGYVASQSGWMETSQFFSWFETIFLPHTEDLRRDPKRPVVLFLDNHYSHVCLELALKAARSNVVIFRLPPNSTAYLQPLDVAVFSAMKQVWSGIVKEWQLTTAGAALKKEDFPKMLSQLWEKGIKPENFVAGFRATGIYPLRAKKSNAPVSSRPQPNEDSQPTVSSQETAVFQGESFTPTTTKVMSHLSQFFARSQKETSFSRSRRIKPSRYGEAMTQETAMARLAEAKRAASQKRQKSRKNKGGSKRGRIKNRSAVVDQNICSICFQDFHDDPPEVQDTWIGCDNDACQRWFHRECLGDEAVADLSAIWYCPECKE